MTHPSNITFESIKSEFVRNAFLKAYAPYKILDPHPIIVRRKPVSDTTMRAQPVINFDFWNRKKRHYRIDISNHTELEQHVPIPDLPEEVLVGWFAHELGHIVDYQHRSAFGMIRFGLGYLLMPTFRIGAERQADIYAIDRGFGNTLLATKTFILEQSTLPDHYKKRIQKYYMSPDEIATLLNEQDSDELKMDELI
ncbi:hypothetical protein [Flavilitoribacter nigricans]|uniref:Uncharacterized protein n=1 Tax=Flavilitoribacter nigricans (strain ATCC 23147 / DSM 23189 / NBRC 102662 / NCIMB 1420 / SS-2) TaxID=1122177 RepID=A0A2D0NCZ7_FLAN2|nr:hypothetical protein [Flavilitoribacter nigricans]PHN06381.1 hypothetical protein CRP01_12490 [Flavilitoribacter nigricans DSM 23189 = NBRC 102662]